MKCGLFVVACVFSLFFAGCVTPKAGQSKTEKRAEEAAARTAALKWLELLDDGDYEEAFEWEAQDFRLSRTQTQFVRSMQARRAPFGHTISRKFIGSAALHKLVGAPDGEYESLIFKTGFEHKSSTAERVILVKQPIGWRVIDYRIY